MRSTPLLYRTCQDIGFQALPHSSRRDRISNIKSSGPLLTSRRSPRRMKMIIRGLTRTQVPGIAKRKAFCLPLRAVKTTRRYSSSNAPNMASAATQSQASMLATISTDLDKIAPKFEVQPDQITIIQTPAEFYATLKVGSCSLLQAFILRYRILLIFDMMQSMEFILSFKRCASNLGE